MKLAKILRASLSLCENSALRATIIIVGLAAGILLTASGLHAKNASRGILSFSLGVAITSLTIHIAKAGIKEQIEYLDYVESGSVKPKEISQNVAAALEAAAIGDWSTYEDICKRCNDSELQMLEDNLKAKT